MKVPLLALDHSQAVSTGVFSSDFTHKLKLESNVAAMVSRGARCGLLVVLAAAVLAATCGQPVTVTPLAPPPAPPKAPGAHCTCHVHTAVMFSPLCRVG